MAKKATARTGKAPSKSTTRIGNARVRGATAADKAAIRAAKATVQAEDTPETKATLPEKKAAATRQFAKADKAAGPKLTAEEVRVGLAARGY